MDFEYTSEMANFEFVFSQARLDSTKRVIRAREETVSMRRVERQFLSMAVAMLFVVGLSLAINTVTMYDVGSVVYEAEVYFNCLKVRWPARSILTKLCACDIRRSVPEKMFDSATSPYVFVGVPCSGDGRVGLSI